MTLPRFGSVLRVLLLCLVLIALAACETLGYYGQAARGQFALLWHRGDIADLLADQELSDQLRDRLTLVLEIRQFAVEELNLPAGDAYLSYVELDRDHVVWNVFAAPEFSVEPLRWCYPIAGCVSYRGYFNEAAALAYAGHLAGQGYDVYTGGVDAYSTLGWFDDPLLSTVIRRPDYQLAALIFHELAHRQVYVPGDTTFNESFATLVEQEGLRRWLERKGDEASLARARQESERRQQFVDLVIDYRGRLEALYEQELSAESMRSRKAALQDDLRVAYRALKESWGGAGGYDSWFASPLNNAQLSTVSSYNELVPTFRRLLSTRNGDLRAFYGEVEQLAALAPEQRTQALERFQ